VAPTLGTPDIFNSCEFGVMGVPFNFFGTQYASTGEGYAGVYTYSNGNGYREYVQAPLLEPLEPNAHYMLSFYVSLADLACASEWMGAYVSISAPTNFGSNQYLNVTPQVESDMGFITDATGWVLISGCFIAQGGEQFITIGNFRPDSETPILPPCVTPLAYYYIDDVSLEKSNGDGDLDIGLGGPEVACQEYVIDPGFPGYYHTWEDGSHEETLTVNESGVYSVSISDGCSFGIDSIEIFVHGDTEFDIGPDMVSICEGDTYTITLDPNFNEYTWNDGSTDAEYSITTSGTYSVTLDDGCDIYSDEITVEVIDGTPEFDLGEDMFLCFDDEIEISLDPELGEFHWQDNSNGSDYTISEEGTYSLTITNVCGDAIDEIIITALEAPEVNIGPDTQQICTGQSISIAIDQGPGEISWQDGSDQNPYLISTPGTYTVLLFNICGTATDQMEVIVADTPYVDFGSDTVLCASGQLTLTANIAGGNYLWQDLSTNDSLTISSPGIYSLIVENFCGMATDSIEVGFGVPVLTFDLGPDLQLCPGEQVILSVPPQNAAIVWQDGSAADTFLVTTAGLYHVQVSNSCGMATDTITVSINGAPPVVDLPAQLTLCDGQTTLLDANLGGVSYLWNDNSSNQQLLINNPGTFSITVSNGCGSDQDTTLVIDGGPAPFVDLGLDTGICAGETITITPQSSDVSSWLWHDGSIESSIMVSTEGMVTVEVSNSCGIDADTMLVGLLPATPPLDLGADTSLCAGESFILSIHTPGVTILWPDGSSGNNYTVNGPGMVAASISNTCGQSFDTIEVGLLPAIPILDLGADQSLCPGELIVINPNILNVEYLWQDGSTNSSYQTTQAEIVYLTISNDCGTWTDTMEIIESTEGPQVDLGPDIQACAGESVIIQSGVSGVDYLWQDGSVAPDFTATQSGTIVLQISNACGTDTDTVLVDISGVIPDPDLGPDTTLCQFEILRLTSSADPETNILWPDGSTNFIFHVTGPGIYTLTESNRCGEGTDTIEVFYTDTPLSATLGPDILLCPGESILLTAPISPFLITWQDGSHGENMLADEAGLYVLQLSNECGMAADTLLVDFDQHFPQFEFDQPISWCIGDVITLDATQPFPADYIWSTGAISPSIEINTPGVYQIEVSTNCLTAGSNIEIIEAEDCEKEETEHSFYIPNVFSPNGDGINDAFIISQSADFEIISITGSIYDRWGGLVFSDTVMPFIWNGLLDGEALLPGVFVYTISVTYLANGQEKSELFKGDVTLVR
jgi:gliding motility-associated-like protein